MRPVLKLFLTQRVWLLFDVKPTFPKDEERTVLDQSTIIGKCLWETKTKECQKSTLQSNDSEDGSGNTGAVLKSEAGGASTA